MRRHPGLVVAVVAMLGVLVLGAFPVRAYFGQVRQREELAARVRTLQAGNDKLSRQAALLQSDETIERLARERFQLVRPGEEAYAILPDAAAPAPAPAVLAAARPPVHQTWVSRAWDRVTSIF